MRVQWGKVKISENPSLIESDAWPARPQDMYDLEKLYSEEMVLAYGRDFDTNIRCYYCLVSYSFCWCSCCSCYSCHCFPPWARGGGITTKVGTIFVSSKRTSLLFLNGVMLLHHTHRNPFWPKQQTPPPPSPPQQSASWQRKRIGCLSSNHDAADYKFFDDVDDNDDKVPAQKKRTATAITDDDHRRHHNDNNDDYYYYCYCWYE